MGSDSSERSLTRGAEARDFPAAAAPSVVAVAATATLIALFPVVVSPPPVHAQVPDSLRAAVTAPDSVVLADSMMITDSLAMDDSLMIRDSLADADSISVRQPLAPGIVTHLTHLTTAFGDTPEGMGLIPTALAEAAIAGQYAWLAGQDSADLGNMTANMMHVLNAIDPLESASGYGLGYGFKRAAENVIVHMELAEAAGVASEALSFHAPFVTRAARGALTRAEEAIAMARRIQRGTDPEEVLPWISQLQALIRAMAYGRDANGDGRIGQTEPGVGLGQAWYHLQLVCRVEDLYMPALVPFPLATDSLTANSLRTGPTRAQARGPIPAETALAAVTDSLGVVMDSTGILTERMRGCG